MRCYYEVLGVPKNVEGPELKKAYYKMSLQWHPDKTSASEQDTTKIFQEIQEAYRVLSDPHERAWYDSHRAQILQTAGRQTQFEEERLDVFKYFTRSCFEAFDDSPKGFYTVYRKVFEDLTEEEIRASDAKPGPSDSSSDDDLEGSDRAGNNGLPYPTFGSSTSSYSQVVSPFYRFWETFQTRKSYTWVEKYDIRIAESRHERRAMETENRRLRNAARKKRNEEIRELVSFVKKRDKRVAAERERIQLANQEAHARSQELSKQTRIRNAVELENEWIQEQQYGGLGVQWTEDFEAELERIESELDQTGVRSSTIPADQTQTEENPDRLSDSSSDSDHLYCPACDKYFASVKARQNHNASKKHRKQVELLRHLLQEEEIQATLDHHQLSDSGPEDMTSNSVAEVKLTKRAKKAQRKRLREAEKQTAENVAEDQDDLVCNEPPVTTEIGEDREISTPDESKNHQPTQTSVLICDTCRGEFPSRNKLFAHLKETNHATLKVVKKTNKNKTRTKR